MEKTNKTEALKPKITELKKVKKGGENYENE